MLHWYQLSFEIPGPLLAKTEAALHEIGALSLTLKDAADQPLLEPAPGDTPLWDTLIVEALFDTDTSTQVLSGQLLQKLAFLHADQIKTKIIENQVWERVWMDRYKPMSFGKRLWIYPSYTQPASENTVNILLDPGLAFGTGTHATTALCLRWLDGQELTGKTLLDYGCGSGVLAIAAIKLGAERVYAVDIDKQALLATHNNAVLNQVNDKIEICHSEQLPAVQVDIVLANIISGILISLHDVLTNAICSNGKLILSGILPTQLEEIRKAYCNEFNFKSANQLEDWCLLEGQKKRH
ncbi:MAG: 50S ribosomal protein L11 methyltransferase [Gammaproteobacteria bacterium]|nr:50S ribosomal protein L11 methyltransferase [Gammaproteobacteria bacterium]